MLKNIVSGEKAIGTYENADDPVHTKTGCIWFKTKLFSDSRGGFLQSYQMSSFSTLYRRYKSDTSHPVFFQDNISYSKKNVVRGMHMQLKKPQAKLVRVLSGSIIDVVLDLNKNSKTYGKFELFKMNNPEQTLYVPSTHAHGFWCTDDCIFSYKCSVEYDPSDESGINPLDERFDFPWVSVSEDLEISVKDKALPYFL